MFKVTRNGDDRLDIELHGKLDSDAMKAALDDLARKSEGITHGRMLYRISDFDFPTLGALGVEMTRLPELFRLIKQFDRAAVLADSAWIRGATQIESALIPGLEIKAFELSEEHAAETWLEQG